MPADTAPALPSAAALTAASLTAGQAAAALRFLAAILPPHSRGRRLKLRLLYERLRLGRDAQSLFLLTCAARARLNAPPLSVGQWLFLLDFCRQNA